MFKALSRKDLIKRVSYLLNSVNISFDLALILKWRQLYKLLKKASKISDKFDLPKKELKEIAKIITVEELVSKRVEKAQEFFGIEVVVIEQQEEEFEYVPFEKPFISFFQDEHPLLLI